MGLFKKLFGGGGNEKEAPATIPGEQSEEVGGPLFAFLCLSSPDAPDPEVLKSNLESWLGQSIGEFEFETGEKTSLSFDVGGRSVIAVLADVPVPEPDIEYACFNAFLWPEAMEEMKKQTCHFIVTVMGEYPDRRAQALELSQVLAALSESFATVGIYWGFASVVHSPEMFREGIKQADLSDMSGLPVHLWIGFLRQPHENGTASLYTTGLSDFGAMEIEVVESKEELSELFEFTHGLATYLLFKGNVIGDGDTVGGSAEHKITTSYEKSVIDRPGTVLRINY